MLRVKSDLYNGITALNYRNCVSVFTGGISRSKTANSCQECVGSGDDGDN